MTLPRTGKCVPRKSSSHFSFVKDRLTNSSSRNLSDTYGPKARSLFTWMLFVGTGRGLVEVTFAVDASLPVFQDGGNGPV